MALTWSKHGPCMIPLTRHLKDMSLRLSPEVWFNSIKREQKFYTFKLNVYKQTTKQTDLVLEVTPPQVGHLKTCCHVHEGAWHNQNFQVCCKHSHFPEGETSVSGDSYFSLLHMFLFAYFPCPRISWLDFWLCLAAPNVKVGMPQGYSIDLGFDSTSQSVGLLTC